MPSSRVRTVWVLGALALLACGESRTSPFAVVTGEWGGDHAELIATPDSGAMEYDCAVGRITEPIRPDHNGVFAAVGTHTPGHGGPIRIDEVLPKRPASYVGHVNGDKMTLTVVMTDSAVAVGTFELVRGRSPRVFKCL
ncbi:MAG: hypothetical protein ACYC5V_13140 [Gemmatimonadaceae bacterium]